MEKKLEEKPQSGTAPSLRRDLAAFGNLRVLCLAAMLAAMSVVLAYLAKLIFGSGPFRITLENLPIIFGGISFGPFVGAMIAVVADLLSCVLAGQAPNPLILVGAVTIGALSGIFGNYVFRKRRFSSLLCTVLFAHLVGSIVLKTLALCIYFGLSYAIFLFRVPVYLIIILVESYLLFVVFKSKQLNTLTERIRRK